MADIYVYPAACDDFSNFGLVGALTPTSCYFEEEANGMSEITLEHPIDGFGKYTQLVCNNLLMVEVPVRTTPEIRNGTIVTSVEQWTVKSEATITKAMRTLYRRATGSSRLKYIPGGTMVTVVEKPAEGRYKVKCSYGTGYMEPDALNFVQQMVIADNSQSIESVQPAWTVKPQVFRIYSVEKGMVGLTVSARHISYDLLFNLTTYKNDGETTCRDALAAIIQNCVSSHGFSAYSNLASVRTGINWTRTNPIDALLNPETGLTTLYAASLVRDNWELYVLHDPGLNRGVTVEYGKNMTGISYTESYEDVVTRIIPIGETKDGNELLLTGNAPWVDSPRINDYPVVYTQELKCENCKVGTDGVTQAMALTRMREQAQAVFDSGADLPQVEMSVDFVNLGDSAEYARFKNLERLYLWDYVIVRHKLHGIDVTSRIVSIKWNCLLDRMEGMEVGSVGKTLANSGITTWQIPTGFSGNKIAGGTIGNAALQSNIIAARHVQAESINTDALQAGSVTTPKLTAGAVTAEKIESGTVETLSLEAYTAKIENLTASDIQTDRLAAALAAFTVVTAGTASFDRATVAHLVAQAMNLEFGVGDNVFIKNLAVEYAQMVGAAIGNLCIKASDGNYYAIDVNENGTVTANRTTVSEGEIQTGQTNAGRVILETSITAQQLNTGNLLATYALVNRIDAARIDVDQLFAREAFIDLLRTSRIVGDKSITMMVEEQETASRTFRQETFPDGDDLVRPNDLLIIPSNGQTYQAVDLSDLNLKFYVDEDGSLHYSLNGSENVYGFEFLNHELYAEGLAFTLNEDGTWEKPYAWVRVQDKEILNSINALVDSVDGKTTTYVQDTTPVNASENDIWYNTATGRILRYSGNTWADITTVALKAALDAAGDAQATADGKIITFAQTTAPAATSVGDLWINTANDNMIYRWNGSGWMPFRDQLILSVQNKAEFATVYDSETPPTTAPETGKLWMDRSVVPPILRRWKGTGTDTSDRENNWETVNDAETIKKAQGDIEARQKALETAYRELPIYMEVNTKNVCIGRRDPDHPEIEADSELHLDNEGIGVVVKGQTFSRFEANCARFGNMEIRRPSAAGGLILDAADDPVVWRLSR